MLSWVKIVISEGRGGGKNVKAVRAWNFVRVLKMVNPVTCAETGNGRSAQAKIYQSTDISWPIYGPINLSIKLEAYLRICLLTYPSIHLPTSKWRLRLATLERGASIGSIALPARLPRATSLCYRAGITNVTSLNRKNRLGRTTRLPILEIGTW